MRLSRRLERNVYTCRMFMRLARGFGIVLPGLAVTTMLIGCRPSPMTNTVVNQARNPNGRSSAILVERYRHAALSSNVFYVLIISTNEDVVKVTNDENIAKRSALVATKASRLKLAYDNPSTLLVTCEACGVEAIDIMKKLDHVGDTTIRYQGFPQHTAYQ